MQCTRERRGEIACPAVLHVINEDPPVAALPGLVEALHPGLQLIEIARLRRDREDRQLSLSGSVAPKDAVGAGRFVLGVRLEDILSVRAFKRVVFVGIEAWVAQARLAA